MTVDIHLTGDRDIQLDGTGDIRLIAGRDNVRQQHANAAFRAAERVAARPVGPEAEEDFRIALRRELRELQYVNEIESLSVESRGRNTIVAEVTTNAVDAAVRTEVSV